MSTKNLPPYMNRWEMYNKQKIVDDNTTEHKKQGDIMDVNTKDTYVGYNPLDFFSSDKENRIYRTTLNDKKEEACIASKKFILNPKREGEFERFLDAQSDLTNYRGDIINNAIKKSSKIDIFDPFDVENPPEYLIDLEAYEDKQKIGNIIQSRLPSSNLFKFKDNSPLFQPLDILKVVHNTIEKYTEMKIVDDTLPKHHYDVIKSAVENIMKEYSGNVENYWTNGLHLGSKMEEIAGRIPYEWGENITHTQNNQDLRYHFALNKTIPVQRKGKIYYNPKTMKKIGVDRIKIQPYPDSIHLAIKINTGGINFQYVFTIYRYVPKCNIVYHVAYKSESEKLYGLPELNKIAYKNAFKNPQYFHAFKFDSWKTSRFDELELLQLHASICQINFDEFKKPITASKGYIFNYSDHTFIANTITVEDTTHPHHTFITAIQWCNLHLDRQKSMNINTFKPELSVVSSKVHNLEESIKKIKEMQVMNNVIVLPSETKFDYIIPVIYNELNKPGYYVVKDTTKFQRGILNFILYKITTQVLQHHFHKVLIDINELRTQYKKVTRNHYLIHKMRVKNGNQPYDFHGKQFFPGVFGDFLISSNNNAATNEWKQMWDTYLNALFNPDSYHFFYMYTAEGDNNVTEFKKNMLIESTEEKAIQHQNHWNHRGHYHNKRQGPHQNSEFTPSATNGHVLAGRFGKASKKESIQQIPDKSDTIKLQEEIDSLKRTINTISLVQPLK